MFPNPDEPAVLFKTASILNLSNCNLILDTREGGPFVIVKKKKNSLTMTLIFLFMLDRFCSGMTKQVTHFSLNSKLFELSSDCHVLIEFNHHS